jgi:hypothetical protein
MESIGFKNLFDSLRRTKALLVIPRLVREEVVTKYAQLLEHQAQKTAESIKALNRLILSSGYQINFRSPTPKYAVREVRKKLRAPAKKVACILYEMEVSKFFDIKSISTELTDRAKEVLSTSSGRNGRFWLFGTVGSIQLTKTELYAATLYEIAADTKLAELGYTFTMTAEVSSPSEDFSEVFKRLTLANEPPALLGRLDFPSLAPTTSLFGSLDLGREAIVPRRTTAESKDVLYTVNGRTSVSVRLVGEKCSAIEVEGVEILGVEKAATTAA